MVRTRSRGNVSIGPKRVNSGAAARVARQGNGSKSGGSKAQLVGHGMLAAKDSFLDVSNSHAARRSSRSVLFAREDVDMQWPG